MGSANFLALKFGPPSKVVHWNFAPAPFPCNRIFAPPLIQATPPPVNYDRFLMYTDKNDVPHMYYMYTLSEKKLTPQYVLISVQFIYS